MLGAIGSQVGQFIERTQAQAALDTAYAKMEAILGSMPCALLIVNCNLQITYANPTASRYFSSGGERGSLLELSLRRSNWPPNGLGFTPAHRRRPRDGKGCPS